MSYEFLQQYWWFLVSLLGAILVFLLFVQGGNSLLFSVGQTDEERRLLVNSTGRKWEFTFTAVLQHQLRRGLLAVDDNTLLVCAAGSQL